MTPRPRDAPHVAIIGAGFGGLAAAWELVRCGVRVTVLEADDDVGGLAGSFDVNGERLEKFYHHWFTTDHHVTALVRELGVEDRVIHRQTRTGMYFARERYRLSTPLDLLRFAPLRLADRVRLGLLALRARRVTDWRALESLTAEEWLVQLGGRDVYRVVWEPLLRGKFGPYAPEISAVWFWNKLKLRGGSRDKRGAEVLAYFRGGFAALASLLRDAIEAQGGVVLTDTPVTGLAVESGRATGVITPHGTIDADAVIATPALPIIAELVEPHVPSAYVASLERIAYLANICVVLELDRSLSETYWLNVNDPHFPFVGVIEHTNFEPASTYGGRHLVYLSRYLPVTDPVYAFSDSAILEYCLPHLQRMFPDFDRAWVLRHHVWRARYAQPVVVRRYGERIPAAHTPIRGLHLATMAQVYPEDRGTNYAIREGRRVARAVAEELSTHTTPATRAAPAMATRGGVA
ncbi:MAG TPA: NAD(P)/FAD-dependent oxidoreductase [Gemmatimonadaceae bacterium]|nr:NAD(P)/FAD-dependent oxidoreductase [Gemmatimonadaceae bacterium]